jgi:hypothetical protein
MISAETILGMKERGMKENSGGGEFKDDIFIYCKKFCKCHNVPSHSTTIKNKLIFF